MSQRLFMCLSHLLAGCLVAGCDEPVPPTPPPAQAAVPQTQPATQPSTQPATPPPPLEQYLDLVRLHDQNFPTTQPGSLPLTFKEAARLVFEEPLLLDAMGYLWLSHPRGQDPVTLLGEGNLKRQTFVVTEEPVFTWWKAGHDGQATVEMILRRDDGGFNWLHETGRAQIPAPPSGQEYVWDDAFVYGKSIVVPTVGGAAVLTPRDRPDPGTYFRRYGRRPAERRPDGSGTVDVQHIALADGSTGDKLPRTQIRLDGRGLLAWIPWEDRQTPGGAIGRFIDSTWSHLTGGGWAERPVHLMPLADGSVLQLSLDDAGDADLSAVPLNATPVDRAAVEQLVTDLSARDPTVREAAFVALANYGPGVWPVLSELKEAQPPMVRRQLELLLGDQTRPTFGGLAPEPGPVEVRQWLADGGVILKFRDGILLPDDVGITILERPAWLLIRPGRRTELLHRMVASEVAADPQTQVFVWGDEWIISRPGEPPKRWVLNHFQPLLPQEQAAWQRFVGMDQAGRWLFRTGQGAQPTLVLDVRVPDPSPRLPTWVLETGEGGEAGWDEEGWPVTKLGGAWRLKEEGWEPLDEEAKVQTGGALPEAGPLATAPDGTIYFGGVEQLEAALPDGSTLTWMLPPEAVGTHQARAVVDREGRLFLFNRPGRVVRITRTPDSAQPFVIEATFDEKLPGAMPRRVWLDPAGRICAAYFGDSVAVMWPDGTVPPAIRQMMPADGESGGAPEGHPMQGI